MDQQWQSSFREIAALLDFIDLPNQIILNLVDRVNPRQERLNLFHSDFKTD